MAFESLTERLSAAFKPVSYTHLRVTKRFLEDPERMLQYLLQEDL